MAFRLKRGAPIPGEVRRIVLRQLEIAISELHTVGDPESDEAVHDARRRVKKIRAMIRLVRPVLDKTYRAVDRDLREVSRMLAPVADGQGVIETLNAIAHRYRRVLPPRTIEAAREGLTRRSRQTDERARAEGVVHIAADTLRGEQERVTQWRVAGDGFRAISPGLHESYRRARHMMIVAWSRPTASHYHRWRRFVKDHWFHVRLLENRCGHDLLPYERRLEALDGVLGEYHNVVLLREVLVTDRFVSREETARCLRVVAQYQRVLRRHAEALGLRIYSERPRRFVRRVRSLWRSAPRETREERQCAGSTR